MKDKSQVIKSDNKVSRKKIYHTPSFKVYGNIEVITKGGAGNRSDGAVPGRSGVGNGGE